MPAAPYVPPASERDAPSTEDLLDDLTLRLERLGRRLDHVQAERAALGATLHGVVESLQHHEAHGYDVPPALILDVLELRGVLDFIGVERRAVECADLHLGSHDLLHPLGG